LGEEVIVDMEREEAVFESGFVLLLMLRRWSHKVRVINFQAGVAKGVPAGHLSVSAVVPESVA
jgi:hypothetical protein